MRHYFSVLRGWKANVIGMVSLLLLVIVLPVTIEARDYRIRASDGELYTITFKDQRPRVQDFSVKKVKGKVLRGFTEAERETIVELYWAAKLIGIVRTFHSPNTPPYGGVEWVNELSADSLKKLKWRQGATYISGKFITTLHIILTGGFSLPEAIATEISGIAANESEKMLLLSANMFAHVYAEYASSEEAVLRSLWYSYENRSTIIQIEEIDAAWKSFHKMARYMALASEIMNKYLHVPDLKDRLATYARGITPVAQNIEHLNTSVYSYKHAEALQNRHVKNMERIQKQALSRVVRTKQNLRKQFEDAVFVSTPIDSADLVVELISVSNDTLAPGERFQLNTTVQNIGRSASGPTTLRFYSSSDPNILPDDTQLHAVAIRSLNTGKQITPWKRFTAPSSPGTYYYRVCLDSVQGESNTNNNCATTTISVSVQNKSPERVDQISNQTLQSIGSVVSLDLSKYFRDPDGDSLIYTVRSNNTNIATLDVSGTYLTLTSLHAGSATVRVTASDGSLAAMQHFTITVQSTSVQPKFRAGDSIIVQNASGGGLNGLIVRNGAGIGFAHIISVFNGATGSIIDGPKQNDGYTWWRVRWDHSNVVFCDVNPCIGWVFESFRGTNVIAKNTRQPDRPNDTDSQPDLVVESARVSDTTLEPGDRFKFYATVRNQGSGEADRTTLRYYLSIDSHISSSDNRVDTDSVTSLDPNESDEVWDSLTAPDTPGTYYYGACVDSVTEESNVSNNCSTAVRITVQNAQTSHGLGIGDSIFVQNASGGGLNGLIVRSGAGTGFAHIISVFNGATGSIIDGPRQNNGYTWWRVRWDHSNQVFCDVNPCIGWVFESFGGVSVITETVLAAPAHNNVIPTGTALLPNYPNPFNPETWLPYQLSEASDVTVRIYSMNGNLVRILVLGHQSAGTYQSKSRAAYWDGRNELGESVASGVYFYTFTAGDFAATRKMLIRK